MSLSKQQYHAYSQAMQTMAGTRQVIMLYDGVLRNMAKAKEAMENQDIETRFHTLTRASEIIFGLQSCLDFDKGGEVAKTLYNFYSSMDAQIFTLHRSGDMGECERLISDIKQMRDVWEEIDRNDMASAAAQEAADSEGDVSLEEEEASSRASTGEGNAMADPLSGLTLSA